MRVERKTLMYTVLTLVVLPVFFTSFPALGDSPPLVILVPGSDWEYTFIDPTLNAQWNTTSGRGGNWLSGKAPFSNTDQGEFRKNTLWEADGADGDDLWIRRVLDLTGFNLSKIHWALGVDNGYKLYINGKSVDGANEEGFTHRWEYKDYFPPALLKPGKNVIALALEDHGGMTAFDMQVTGIPKDAPPLSSNTGSEMPDIWDEWDTYRATDEIIDEITKDPFMEELIAMPLDRLTEKLVREKNADKLARMEAVYKRKLLKFLQDKLGLYKDKSLPKITKKEIEALKKMYRYSPSTIQRFSSLASTWKGLKRIFNQGVPSYVRGRIGKALTAKLFSKVLGPASIAMDLYTIYEFVIETEKLKDSWSGALKSFEQAEGTDYDLYLSRKNLPPEQRKIIEDLRRREEEYFKKVGGRPPFYPPWPGEKPPPRPKRKSR